MSGPASICFVTLGCAKNEVDTNRMRALVAASDLHEIDEPSCADVVVLNTCSFITEATEETLETIFQILALQNFAAHKAKLVVTGCMPARYGETLDKELPEVAAFLPASQEDGIVELCYKVLGDAQGRVQSVGQDSLSPASQSCVSCKASAPTAPTTSLRVVDAPWAYLKISEGCSRCCSFCTIPHIRGPYRSRSYTEIVTEVEQLVSGGVHEIILIGQDTGLWAYDFAQNADAAARSAQTGRAEPGGAATKDTAKEGEPSPQNLAQLLDALATAYPRTWFRVMYLQPQGISDDLLDVMARHHTLCNYLDIPLQHANARILADMNRSGSTHDYTKLLARIRKVLPNVVLRTTLIAGFPGEGRHEADELVRFVEQADFDYVGVFAYSQEDGTQAGMRSDQVPLRTRKARQQRLRDAADVAGFARASEYVGSTVEVLVCGEDEEGVYGRTQGQAPDVDGIVHIEDITLDDARAQGIVQVHIAEAVCYDLYGRVVTLNV